MISIVPLQVLGGICQSLLIKYGIGYSTVLGVAYSTFLTTACACLFSTGVLLLCYLLSAPSVSLVRQSFFVSCCSLQACVYQQWEGYRCWCGHSQNMDMPM